MGKFARITALAVGLIAAGFIAGFMVRLLIPAGRSSPEKR